MLREVTCEYDGCHTFTPAPHGGNARYCQPCRCKDKVWNAKRRIYNAANDTEELWELQEGRKRGRTEVAKARNAWLLERSKIGFYDIETSNLDASIGLMLCACVKIRNSRTLTFTTTRRKGMLDDRQALVGLRDAIESLDLAVGFYSTRFDLVFINTRLIMLGERPIDHIRHLDLYYTARYKLKLHSNRLDVVAETVLGKSNKTRVVGPIWTRAIMGDNDAMKFIIDHCRRDVQVLGDVFEKLLPFVNLSGIRWRKLGAAY